jgi:ribonuclease-3
LTDWQKLQQDIGIFFNDLSLLQQAFLHSSFVNENQDNSLSDNERLEFLGDAVLNLVVAEKVYHEFPDLAEGALTTVRTSLIREDTLVQLGADLGTYLQLGKGEETSGGRQRQSNLADTFEALLGAIFLDQGFSIVKGFILSRLDSHVTIIKTRGSGQNYKAKLQEFTQGTCKQLPVYHIIQSSGPDHDKKFIVEVTLDNRVLGTGSGKSKKAAEIEAARSACEKLIPD